MLHILLTILKIIGILLLVIIGLILLVLACVLFVPIRYGAFIRRNESTENDLNARVKVTYLLHIISLNVFYKDRELIKELRIFGFKTKLLERKKNGAKDEHSEPEKFGKNEVEIEEINFSDSFDSMNNNSFNEMNKNGNNESYQGKGKTDRKENDSDKNDSDKSDPDKSDSDKNDSDNKISDNSTSENVLEDTSENSKENIFVRFKNKITQIIRKIKFQFRNICGKIKKAKETVGNLKEKAGKLKAKAGNIKDFLQEDNTKITLTFLKGEFIRILKHISPKKIRGYIRFGLGDPYNTGQILGIIYAVMRGARKNLDVYADFDEKVFETDIEIKGRMQIYYFVYIAVRIYFNDEFKKLLARKKELDAKNAKIK